MDYLDRKELQNGWTYVSMEDGQHHCDLPRPEPFPPVEIPGVGVSRQLKRPIEEEVGTLYRCRECKKLWQSTPRCDYCWMTSRPGTKVPEFSMIPHQHTEGNDWRAASRKQIRQSYKIDRRLHRFQSKRNRQLKRDVKRSIKRLQRQERNWPFGRPHLDPDKSYSIPQQREPESDASITDGTGH